MQRETPRGVRSKKRENFFWLFCVAVVVGLGLQRFLEDGSLWLDEAFIALTLKSASPLDLFGPVGMGHSFPRVYLLAIHGLTQTLGYETWALRLLPFAFFAVATALWFRLLFNRIFAFPALMLLALFLNLMPVSWFEYSSAFKQYTFDVFAALLPFFVSEAALRKCFREGKSRWVALALALPCALSYTYGIVLLARVAGWYAYSLRDRQPKLDPGTVAIAISSLLIGSASLYLTDIRFMANSVYDFWQGSTLAADGSSGIQLILQLIAGPYSGIQEVGRPAGIARPFLYFLYAVFGLGLLRILLGSLNAGFDHAPSEWGSRSLGAVVAVMGLLVASWLIDYPIASGRLTLFVLPLLQIILFEGFCVIHREAEKLRQGAWISLALGLIWIGFVAPSAIETSLRFIERENRDNIRSLQAEFEARPDLPIYTMPLLVPSVMATPHGPAPSRFVMGPPIQEIPWDEEIFIIDNHQGQSGHSKRNPFSRMKEAATQMEKVQGDFDTLYLFRAQFPPRGMGTLGSPVYDHGRDR